MASLNMAKVNTLFRKGYLLAGVIIAANMFTMNEVKASIASSGYIGGQTETEIKNQQESSQKSDPNTQKIKFQDSSDIPAPQPKQEIFGSLLFGLLSHENLINFFGGLFFSVANNYLNLWDYNPGLYCNLRIGCLGLRSKRFLNGMLQFEGNLNLIRGTLWLIPGVIDFVWYFIKERRANTNTAALIMRKILKQVNGNETKFGFFYSIFFLVQGFVSIPLTLHFSKFSISISLDSLIWGLTGMILEKKVLAGVPIEGAEKKDDKNDKDVEIDDIEYKNKLNEETDKNDIKDEFKKDDE